MMFVAIEKNRMVLKIEMNLCRLPVKIPQRLTVTKKQLAQKSTDRHECYRPAVENFLEFPLAGSSAVP
jgi:hypothetical protein